jgi:hypothetical protein
MTLLLRLVRILINLGSATMANGRWHRTAQRASFIRSLSAKYVKPCTNEVMAWETEELEGSQPSVWCTRLLVLSSCQVCETLMDGWLNIDDMLMLVRN